MARMRTLPGSDIIIGSRGRVDYYLWNGIPVARAWPKYVPYERSAGEVESSQEFTAAAKMTSGVASHVAELYREIQVGQGVTWVDHFRASARGKPWIKLRG